MDIPQPRRIVRGRQKRPRVPDSLRKRAARACLACRHHKEKCQGGVPCLRCQQYNRTCRFESFPARTSQQSNAARAGSSGVDVSPQRSDREHQMARIIRHFLGDVPADSRSLQDTADSLESNGSSGSSQDNTGADDDLASDSYSLEPLSTSTMHYSGELSHWNFSKMLRRRLQSRMDSCRQDEDPEMTDGFFRATGLQSSSSSVAFSRTYFPPRDIADFLTRTFFEFAQTNYFYFDESAFRQKMDYYYTVQRPLAIEDAGWICTILLTMAVGTQFAYMQPKQMQPHPPSLEEIPDDRIGLQLYRFACRLIPDLITIASVETVSAFLLLGVYTLPIDTSGLAYTYFGLAIKMAVQNGMHRKFPGTGLDVLTIELRNRLWWSAYSLESRISILHGRPASVSITDINAALPNDVPELRPPSGVSNIPNLKATIHLTRQLGAIAQVILRLRRCPQSRQSHLLQHLMGIRTGLTEWWESLPRDIHCRDLSPDGPLFRCNVHLELTYAIAIIYTGRPFLFLHADSRSHASLGPNRAELNKTLTDDCLHSAIRIIDLCQLLQDSVGLARVSYTEFSSCRAALLALIAQRLYDSSEQVCSVLARGMTLIRQMCVGLESARSEVAVIEALEHARQQLEARSGSGSGQSSTPDSGYDQFQRWARLWDVDSAESDILAGVDNAEPSLAEWDSGHSFDGFFSSFAQELDAFAAIPGSELIGGDSGWGMQWNEHDTTPI